MKNKKLRKAFSLFYDLLFFILIIVMLASAFIFYVSDKTDKSFYGYRIYEVLTNSMEKTNSSQKGNFVAGDMIVVKITEPEEIKVGDIITFVPNSQSADTYLTHRVKRIEEVIKGDQGEETKNQRLFITQGDANNREDPPTQAKNVIGIVTFSIPKAGKIVNVIRNNPVETAVFVIAFLLLITLLKGYFLREKKSEKRKRRKRSLSSSSPTSQRKKKKRKRRSSRGETESHVSHSTSTKKRKRKKRSSSVD